MSHHTVLCFAILLGLLSPLSSHAASDPDETTSTHHIARKALIQGKYKTGEIVSKSMIFEPGQRMRVEWDAKPAQGDCVISLFSIFNADLLFGGGSPKPKWSEIAFETFGGSVNNGAKQFQTQYITQNNPNASPTQRGQQHLINHDSGDRNTANIFDGSFHKFQIEWLPKDSGTDSQIIYRLDGTTIRTVNGGDANLLEPPLDIYAGVWVAGSGNGWACTDRRLLQATGYCNWNGCNGSVQGGSWCNESENRCRSGCGGTWCTSGSGGSSSDDPTAEVVVRSVKVHEQVGSSWVQRENFQFRSSNDLNDWVLSDWTFGGFDGAFDPSAVVVSDNQLFLEVVEN